MSFSSRNTIFIKIVMKEISLKKKATRVRAMRMLLELAEKSTSRICTGGSPDSGVYSLVWILVPLFTSYITEQVTQLLCIVPCLENRDVNNSTYLTGLF